MSVVLNTKHLSGFINEEEYKAIYPQVEAAHNQLEAKNGPGNDFLGWMYLPRDYDKEEFARIKEAAKKIREAGGCRHRRQLSGCPRCDRGRQGPVPQRAGGWPQDLLLRQQHQPQLSE